jgi:hypothetical protein
LNLQEFETARQGTFDRSNAGFATARYAQWRASG